MARHHTMKTRTAAIENIGAGCGWVAHNMVIPAYVAGGYNVPGEGCKGCPGLRCLQI